jgi:putative effector of murein hydrolase LrgA (UPF0299 family)
MMDGVELMKQMAVPLLTICVVTTLLIMGATGLVSQAILKKGKKEEV